MYVDKNTQNVVLAITDHLDWENVTNHLYSLQEKLNTYFIFIETGELYGKYPNAIGRRAEIKIVLKYEPVSEFNFFLMKVNEIIKNKGYLISYEVFKKK